MTHGETFYLFVVLATFGAFIIGVGRASWHQTQKDRRASAARPAQNTQGMHPAE